MLYASVGWNRISHSLRAPLNISPVEDDRLVIGVDCYARDLAEPVEMRCPVVQLHLKSVTSVIISADSRRLFTIFSPGAERRRRPRSGRHPPPPLPVHELRSALPGSLGVDQGE